MGADEVAAAIRQDPLRALVALDFDGTLSPMVPDPTTSRLVVGGREVLDRLAARVGTLAIVTGRPAADVVRLGGLSDLPRLRVLGHYGLQDWYDGRLSTPDPEPGVTLVRERLPELLADAPDGVEVEDKQHSLVVHTRRSADPQATLDAFAPALRTLAADAGLEAVPGRLVLELRPTGTDKGGALRQLVDTAKPAVVVYVGDDVGDLPAFDVVAAFVSDGGLGLAVAVTDDDAPAEVRERADLVLDGPAEAVRWLGGLVG